LQAPLLNAQREEFERAKVEAAENADRLQRTMAEAQAQTKAANEASQKLAASTRENELLTKQLNDLGRQISALLRDIARRDNPTLPPDAELDADPATQPAANTEELITNHLVLFRSVDGLQAQNQRLLKIVRELGDKLEREERGIREQCEQEQFEAVREAHEMIQELEGRLEAQRAANERTLAAYTQERDTLRDMLSRAGQSVPTAAAPQSEEDIAASRKLAEMQDHFDAYHAETGADARRLRDDLVASQRERHALESALKKAEAQADVATEHHRIMQDSLSRTKRELQELEGRHQKLTVAYARAEAEYHAVADAAHDAKGDADRLRNECANLRAEKKIWAGVESRLVEENRQLGLERSKLSDLMSNVQRMHSDLERSGETDRRRLESQLELVQSQVYVVSLVTALVRR
jgi:nucleoprotein TPR